MHLTAYQHLDIGRTIGLVSQPQAGHNMLPQVAAKILQFPVSLHPMYVFAQVREPAERSSHSGVFHQGLGDGVATRNSGGHWEDVLAPQQSADHKLQVGHCRQTMLPQQPMDDIELLQRMHHVHSIQKVLQQAYLRGTHIEHSTDERLTSAPLGPGHAKAL